MSAQTHIHMFIQSHSLHGAGAVSLAFPVVYSGPVVGGWAMESLSKYSEWEMGSKLIGRTCEAVR